MNLGAGQAEVAPQDLLRKSLSILRLFRDFWALQRPQMGGGNGWCLLIYKGKPHEKLAPFSAFLNPSAPTNEGGTVDESREIGWWGSECQDLLRKFLSILKLFRAFWSLQRPQMGGGNGSCPSHLYRKFVTKCTRNVVVFAHK